MKVTVQAPAKLNITLDVLGKREDGYHLLDMIVQTVTLCDTLEIELNESGNITLFESSGNLPIDEDNLAFAAARLLLQKAGSKKGAEIKLFKRIPIAAGLGGGSSDAAAVLKGLNSLLGNPFSLLELAEMSVVLGADVPMCVLGGAMRARGIGEVIEALPALPECWFVVTKNGKKPSTGAMYRRLGEVGISRRPDTEGAIKAICDGDLDALCRGIYNVFLPACDDAIIAEDIALLRGTKALGVGLSGSGPSVFGIFKTEASAKAAQELLIKNGKNAFLCEPTK